MGWGVRGSERESEIKKRKERAAGGGGAVECAEVCMSSEGFQLSQTIGGGKALCMTIGSLTPVKLAGGRTGEDGGVPICLRRAREYVCVHLYSAVSLNAGVHVLWSTQTEDWSCGCFLTCTK